jgi:hypothetical protein
MHSTFFLFPCNKVIKILLIFSFLIVIMQTGEVSAATATGASANGLLLYYPFDTGSTNSSVALDRSGRGNTGTQTNFLGLTTGKIGQAIQFDGATRYVTASNVASLQLTTLTASIWVKTSGAGTGYRAIFLKSEAWGMFFGGGCSDNVFNVYNFTTLTSACSSAGATNDGLWHNYTCTIQSGVTNGTKCYMDGSLILTTTYTVNVQTFGVTVGVNQGVQPITASMDEARIYNRILSTQEIQALANGKTGSTTNKANNLGLVGWWTFDPNKMTNATATDSAGANNGTLVNMTLANSSSTGKLSQALSFSGTKYISLPIVLLLI